MASAWSIAGFNLGVVVTIAALGGCAQGAGSGDAGVSGEPPSVGSPAAEPGSPAAVGEPLKTAPDERLREPAWDYEVTLVSGLVRRPAPAAARPEAVAGRLAVAEFVLAENVSTAGTDLGPANLQIAVFEYGGGAEKVALGGWLERRVPPLPRMATLTKIDPQGGLEALRVDDPRELSPNRFFYFRGRRFIYQLTPVGPLGDAMVTSFRILPPP